MKRLGKALILVITILLASGCTIKTKYGDLDVERNLGELKYHTCSNWQYTAAGLNLVNFDDYVLYDAFFITDYNIGIFIGQEEENCYKTTIVSQQSDYDEMVERLRGYENFSFNYVKEINNNNIYRFIFDIADGSFVGRLCCINGDGFRYSIMMISGDGTLSSESLEFFDQFCKNITLTN